MYKFWYSYVKSKNDEKAKSCYMDTYSVIVQIKTDDIYNDIGEDIESRFYTSKYELDRPMLKGKK